MPRTKSNETPQPESTLRPPHRNLPSRRRRVPKPIIIYPKLRYRRSDRGERLLTVASLIAGDAEHPMIRMRGGWLAKLGFKIGARIAVSEERGRLVVTLAREE
jgi:Toxin SymE, type I toxin-antitoxin system